ncbi:haloacid dehalogenase-like hydrolase [Streptomyces sp. B1866]|uniref:HAD family hydrolase n=1 Tax=Streptomyces sp. B1866 TaxID=3075431 RepID=UPI0028921E4B|nr:haloacid dehalogenase-like hydrolase [Streptomyces sp. B1866]MDT3397534.1 haloacid dehalogenase-like hydrolase [Streptomyces sp. B1866]
MTTGSKSSYDGAALVLWDVDHTLVNAGGVGRIFYARAFEAVTGRPLTEIAPMTGRTERAIITDTLRLNGVSNPDALFDNFYSALGVASEQSKGRIRELGRVLAGAAEAIASFDGGHAVQSLVTGNIRPIAIAKLRAFDLAASIDFEVGGYGDDGHDRADLVRLARERAETKYDTSFAGKRTFIIGDTPHDITGAHGAGAFAIGVATGSSNADELEAAGADLVLSSLTELDALRAAILGRV